MKTKILLTLLIFTGIIGGMLQSNAQKPNILFCIMDDASPTMGAYGCKYVKTPAFIPGPNFLFIILKSKS